MFGSKSRSKRDSRRELIESMPVDGNGDVTEDYLRARHAARSPRSRMADERSMARKVYPLRMPPEQAVSWVAHPGRCDVEGIDTKGKANVKRRERKPSKTPAKPEGPIPVKDSGAIVSGREITDVARLCVDADCTMMLGNGVCSMVWEGTYGYALSRCDGKDLYGLDPGASSDLFVYHAEEISGLDPNATYKVSLEGNIMVFRTGEDFSEVALMEQTMYAGNIRTPEDVANGCSPAMFEFDPAAVTLILEKMAGAGVRECKLASTKWGISLSSDDGFFDFIIGPRIRGLSGSSVFKVAPFLTMMRALAPHVDSMGFCPDGAFVMKGEFGDYTLTAAMKRSADTVIYSGNSKRRFKQLTGRRNKR